MHRIKRLIALLPTTFFVVAAVGFFSGCDSFDPEVIPDQSKVTFRDEPIVLYPFKSRLLDLNSLVTSASDNYRITITTLPEFGRLQAVSDLIVEYSPNWDVTEGRDAFVISVFGNDNMLIGTDSIKFIITADPALHPCELQANDDDADMSVAVDGIIYINVLANDIACGIDPAMLEVSLFEGDSAASPKFGTAKVLADGRIRYTPFDRFFGTEVFYYRVTKPANSLNEGDGEQTSIATVYVDYPVACYDSPMLLADTIRIPFDQVVLVDSVTQDTRYNLGPFNIDIFSNDAWCPNDSAAVSIVRPPVTGVAEITPDIRANYTFNEGNVFQGFQDNFSYSVCSGGECDETDVVIILE